jgi:hypothetical protein
MKLHHEKKQLNQRRHLFLNFFKGPRNQFQGIDSASLCSLAGQYDNTIPARFLAPIDYSKVPAQVAGIWARICKRLRSPGIDSKESIPPAYVACAGILERSMGLGTE